MENRFRNTLLIAVLGFPMHVTAQESADEIRLLERCSEPATLISTIQGKQSASPLINDSVEVEAVVIGVFQKPSQWDGFFIQEQDADSDGDHKTSEGLFVRSTKIVEQGNTIRLQGRVRENEGQTELDDITALVVCQQHSILPAATVIRLPVASGEAFEDYEGMRLTLPQDLIISDLYGLSAYGELRVSGNRLFQPTHLFSPGDQAQERAQANEQNQLIVDDGFSGTGLPIVFKGQDNATPFSAINPLRAGQQLSGLSGILHYSAGAYRIQPDSPFTIDASSNPRPALPGRLGRSLRIAVFNVLNFFTTVDDSGPICGPGQNESCRGADSNEEKIRQQDKLLSALRAIDADILGLVELENNERQSLDDILAGLNATSKGEIYRHVATGSIGEDVIKVGLIYRTTGVSVKGNPAILNSSVDERFEDKLSRPALAQTFQTSDQNLLTIILTHLKSKRCTEQSGPDADQGDGQACFNHSRSAAAAALADWSAADPTSTGSNDFLLMGDFNSHRMEDPIQLIQNKGLVNLMTGMKSEDSYTHSYNGLAGSLDHVFASPKLAARVSGITVWHINADESALLDYNNENERPDHFYNIDPYRTSDHDPIIVDLELTDAAGAANDNKAPAADKRVMIGILALLLFLFLLLTVYLKSRRRQ